MDLDCLDSVWIWTIYVSNMELVLNPRCVCTVYFVCLYVHSMFINEPLLLQIRPLAYND